MPLYTIDLFAGAGGLTEGFRQAQFQTALANDIDENAKQTFTYNHPTVPFITGNIQSFSPNDYHDVNKTIHAIIGGPPCQGFSVAGKRLSNDPRNQLFKEYIRIVHSVKPQVIMFENVPGIITIQNGQIVSAILSELKSIGYNCDYQIINSPGTTR
jgi:DNA (cytosine-5)-methyltransferase 1